MPRRWTSFDSEVTNREFLALPEDDRKALFGAMKLFRLEAAGGYVVSNYGDGLLMIKAANQTQGRCLFFTIREVDGVEVATALLAYKKESQKAEKQKMETARQRMRMARGE
ncbi:MAG: type II toxin-antitoxin system RelE/ParE family toxin [Fimbriimonas sp.]